MIITIDGAAGTGKSTVAKRLSSKMNFEYFDTGAMYRAFAFYVLDFHINPSNEHLVSEHVKTFKFQFLGSGPNKTYFVNDIDVTSHLRTPEVTEISSIISQYPEVRNALHQVQKNFAQNHNAVFEGRDLGTVIFPNADFKFFLKASDEVRAHRRLEEMKAKGISASLEEVLGAMRMRDARDQGRKVAPLKCPDNAHVIDTSLLSIESVVDQIIKIIKG